MKLRASKTTLEANRTAPILPLEVKAVEIPVNLNLKAQRDEFKGWLEAKVETSTFAFFVDMLKKISKDQELTPNMVAALRKCIIQDIDRVKDKSNAPKPIEEEDLPTITLKVKKFWMTKNDLGSRVITGKILRETAKAYLLKGHADMIEGSWCMRCGKELTEPASMLIGYGPTCCEKLGVPYPSNILTASKKERLAIRKKLLVVLHAQEFEAWVPKSQIEEIIKGSF